MPPWSNHDFARVAHARTASRCVYEGAKPKCKQCDYLVITFVHKQCDKYDHKFDYCVTKSVYEQKCGYNRKCVFTFRPGGVGSTSSLLYQAYFRNLVSCN